MGHIIEPFRLVTWQRKLAFAFMKFLQRISGNLRMFLQSRTPSVLLCLLLGNANTGPTYHLHGNSGPLNPQITASEVYIWLTCSVFSEIGVPHEQQLMLFFGYNFVVHPVKAFLYIFIRFSGTWGTNCMLLIHASYRPFLCDSSNSVNQISSQGDPAAAAAWLATQVVAQIFRLLHGIKTHMNLTRVTLNTGDTLLLWAMCSLAHLVY